jgi:hypothetical protein
MATPGLRPQIGEYTPGREVSDRTAGQALAQLVLGETQAGTDLGAAVDKMLLNQAAKLSEMVDMGLVTPGAQVVANIIVKEQGEGKDTALKEQQLRAMVPDDQTYQELIGVAKVYQETGEMSFGQTVADEGAFEAAQLFYEGLVTNDDMIEARSRMMAGQPIEDVVRDVESRIDAQSRAMDFAMQVVLDPLNVAQGFKMGQFFGGQAGRVTRILGKRAALYRAADHVGTINKWGDIAAPGVLGRIPVVGPAFRLTLDTRLGRITNQAYDTMIGLYKYLDNSPIARLTLREMGLQKFEAITYILKGDPDSLAKLGAQTMQEAVEILGMPGGKMQLQGMDEAFDFFAGRGAQQTGEVLRAIEKNNLGPALAQALESGDDVLEVVAATLRGEAPSTLRRLGTAVEIGKEKGFRAGLQAFQHPVVQASTKAGDDLAKALNIIREGAIEVIGEAPKSPGLLKRTFNTAQGIQATFAHMGFNPGWLWKNALNDTYAQLEYGINAFTPTINTIDMLQAWDLGGATALQREFGGHVGRGIAATAGEASLFGMQRRIEAASGRKIYAQGFQSGMMEFMDKGLINRRSFAGMQAAFEGNNTAKGKKLMAYLRTAWTNGDLDSLSAQLLNRTITNPDTIMRGTKNGILWDIKRELGTGKPIEEVFDTLKRANIEEIAGASHLKVPPPDSIASKISDYQEAGFTSQFRDKAIGSRLADNMNAVVQEQMAATQRPMAAIDNAIEAAEGRLPKEVMDEIHREWSALGKQIRQAHASVGDFHTNALERHFQASGTFEELLVVKAQINEQYRNMTRTFLPQLEELYLKADGIPGTFPTLDELTPTLNAIEEQSDQVFMRAHINSMIGKDKLASTPEHLYNLVKKNANDAFRAELEAMGVKGFRDTIATPADAQRGFDIKSIKAQAKAIKDAAEIGEQLPPKIVRPVGDVPGAEAFDVEGIKAQARAVREAAEAGEQLPPKIVRPAGAEESGLTRDFMQKIDDALLQRGMGRKRVGSEQLVTHVRAAESQFNPERVETILPDDWELP